MKRHSISLLPLIVGLVMLAPVGTNAQVTNCPGMSVDMTWGCNSPTSGWAAIDMITGATNPTEILWSTGATSHFISGLPNGEHWLKVTDANGCYVKKTFTVGCWISPDCTLDIVVEWGCMDTTSAWASVTTTGATGTLETLWSNGATTQYVTGLTNGAHWVWVKEADDCWVKKSFYVACEMDPDCPLVVDMENGCDENGGWAMINEITGANESTEVHWSNGEQTMGVSGLSNGLHYLVVMNSETCWRKEHFVVECGPVSDCLFDATVEFGCMDTTSGWASVAITGDPSNPTTILWSNGASGHYVPGLPNGAHWVMVTDDSGCMVQKHFTIACQMDPDCPLEVGLEHGCDEDGGYASISGIVGAIPETEVHWSNGAQTMEVSGLADGLHYLVVMNSETCWRKEHFIVTCGVSVDCELTAMVEWGCLDTLSAWASVAVTGATDVTSILWSNDENVQHVTGLSNGEHWVMVSQSEDCWAMDFFTVDCAMDPDCPLEVELEYGCDMDGGWASVENIVGTTPTTEVHWSTGDQTMAISGLDDGLYYLVVMNSETCWRKEHFVLECDTPQVNIGGTSFQVNTFPMPASDLLNVEVQADQSGGTIALLLMDATGRNLMSQGSEIFMAGESRTLNMNIGALGNGSYMLAITRNGEIVSTQRVIVAR